MFQPEKTSLKQKIKLVLAFANAGFELADSKSVDTDDGCAWRATLTHRGTKIVTVSNGGYGGPDETRFHATSEAGKAVDKLSLETLFAVPEIAAAVRGHMLYNLDLDKQYSKVEGVDFSATQREIEDTVPLPTADNIEFLVGHIADVTTLFNSVKRAIKTKLLVVFEGGDESLTYIAYKLDDTPTNRERVKAHEKKRKIDYFLGDLFTATSLPKGA